MKTNEIIASLKVFTGLYKEDEINELVARKDEATPLLIDVLKQVLTNIEDYTNTDNNYWDHLYAVNLLALFEAEAAHDVIIDLFSLAGNTSEILFGDTVTEDLPIILLRTCGEDLTKIKLLVENKKANPYCRASAIVAMSFAMNEEFISREDLVEYYRALLVNIDAKDLDTFEGILLSEICDIYPEELLDDVKVHFQKHPYNQYVEYEDFVEVLEHSQEAALTDIHENAEFQHQRIEQIHSMKRWGCFNTDNGNADFDFTDDELGRGDLEQDLDFLRDYVNSQTSDLVKNKSQKIVKSTKEVKSKKKQAKASKKANRKKKK